MKTHKCNLLKKPVLVVELPDHTADFSVINTGDRIAISTFDEYDNCLDVKGIPTNYTLLGKPDEIKESDAEELVESWESVASDGTTVYQNYHTKIPKKRNALESFFSAMESKIYWENPFGKTPPIDMSTLGGSFGELYHEDYKKGIENWNEAQTRTFDRNRTLIFIETPKI